MSATKKVRIMERVGDPSSGVVIQPGTVVELPEVWADRYIAQGKAELVTEKPKADKPSTREMAAAIDKFEKKIADVSPGDVLVSAAKQKGKKKKK